MQKITPFLWFNGNAEEAIKLYGSVFPNFSVNSQTHYPKGTPGLEGTLLTASITVEGQTISLLNGGPQFKLNESFSLVINCDNQDEVDYYWTKLSADGGEEQQCGWLKDKFGLSWQVVPKRLIELLQDKDPGRAGRVMNALLKMKKIDIRTLEAA